MESSNPISDALHLAPSLSGNLGNSIESLTSETQEKDGTSFERLLVSSPRDKPTSGSGIVVPITTAAHSSLPPLQGAWRIPLTISHENLDLPGSQVKDSTERNSNLDAEQQQFPWAAKMKPSTRNLYRVTSPTYMEDGTPKVKIPSHVLLKGLDNQKEFVVGQFYRCSTPPGGLIHAMVNRIWGKKCKIFIRKLGESSYLFHIPDESTRSWVIHRGLWHIDDCLMFVAPWTPAATLAVPEISTIPVWVTLKNIPSQLYSMQGISWIASGLGAPMATNKPRLDPTLLGEAKILVEVELNKPFPHKIAAEDKKGNLSMIDVEYSWLPPKCGRCNQLGHKESRCLQKPPTMDSSKTKTSPLHVPQVQDSCIDSPHQSSPVANDTMHEEAAPNDILLAEVVPLPTEETTSNVEIAPHIMKTAEVHETSTIVAAATHTLENITTGKTFCLRIEAPTITNHSPPLLLSTPIDDPDDNAIDYDLREDVNNDNSELGSLESLVNDANLLTPSTQRILRERPLKPYQKFQEGEWISVSAFRGKRSSGRRGR